MVRKSKKLYGKWFKGNVFSGDFTSKQVEIAVKKYGKGVKKPIAVQTKVGINGKVYSRFYHKPIKRGEFWD